MFFTFNPCLRNDPLWLPLLRWVETGHLFFPDISTWWFQLFLVPCPPHILLEDVPFLSENISKPLGFSLPHQPVQLTSLGRHIHDILWGHRLGKRIGNRSAKFAPHLGRSVDGFPNRWRKMVEFGPNGVPKNRRRLFKALPKNWIKNPRYSM